MAANVDNSNNNRNPNRMTFREFVQSFDPNQRWNSAPGERVDHAQPGTQTAGAFPFNPSDFLNRGRWDPHGGPWAWSDYGPWSRPWGPWRQPDTQPAPDDDGSQETQREEPQEPSGDNPPPHDPQHQGGHAQHPSGGPPRSHMHRGGGRRPRGHDGRRGSHHGSHHGPPPPPPYSRCFAPPPWMHALQNHPLAQVMWNYLQERLQAREDDEGAFSPPIDIFNRPTEWQVHVALPGTKKEDIGVDWDADKSMLIISGVVSRPSDEEFLQSLTMGERRVGLFNRTVKLPPEGTDEKDQINGNDISAKLDSGVLVVTVPKVEKEWTEILRVDID